VRPDLRAILPALTHLSEALDARTAAKRRKALEVRLEVAMRKAFRAQGRAFVKGLKAGRVTYPIREAAAKWGDWEPILKKAMATTLDFFAGPIDAVTTSAILLGAKQVIAQVKAGIAWDLKAAPETVAWLKGRAAERVALINDTTREQMRGLIAQGVDEGWGYNKLAAAITERFEEFAAGRPQKHIESRAHLVAVTEVGEAVSEGQLQAGKRIAAAGIEMEKLWSTAGDARVSVTICAPNGAQGWIPLEQTFQSGHDRTLGHPGCRCDLRLRAKGGPD
jgi:hypothetical protein